MMSPENLKRVQEAVREAGDHLSDRLVPTVEHPERNSYAHTWKCIKEKMGKSYKECDDSDLETILGIVKTERNRT